MSIILWSSHSECASMSMSSARVGAATLIVPRWLPRPLSVKLSSIAFKLNHEILFNKLYHNGIKGDMWVLLRNMYREMTTQVKWDNHLSEKIYINQGIQQGTNLDVYPRFKYALDNFCEDFCYSDSSIICWILPVFILKFNTGLFKLICVVFISLWQHQS
jgi:hypothetical protein